MQSIFCYLAENVEINPLRDLSHIEFAFGKHIEFAARQIYRAGQCEAYRQKTSRFALIKKGGSICKKLSRPIYFSPFLWYNTTNR